MNPDHAHFAEWDAAYILGALSASDRRSFEAHLAGCDECRRAIAEVAPTIGLLGRVERRRAASLSREDVAPSEPDPSAPSPDAVDGPDPALRDQIAGVVTKAARRRRRMRWAGGLAATAAVVVAIVVAVSIAVAPAMRNVTVVAMDNLAGAPLTASVELVDVAWGTRIDLACTYGDTENGAGDGWPYVLTVTAKDGSIAEVSSWRALPGRTARLSAGTAWDAGEIATVEIRTIDAERVIMRADIGETVSG